MKAILACDRAGGIGYNGGLPWPKNKKDLARFKELTMGKTVVMGRQTWQSRGMPKPLPGRYNLIVSSSKEPWFDTEMDCQYDPETRIWSLNGNPNTGIGQLENVEDLSWVVDDDAWFIGGAMLFNTLLDMNLIDELHLSRMRKEYTCDTYIDLSRIQTEFEQTRSQLCLTHFYEIWKKPDANIS